MSHSIYYSTPYQTLHSVHKMRVCVWSSIYNCVYECRNKYNCAFNLYFTMSSQIECPHDLVIAIQPNLAMHYCTEFMLFGSPLNMWNPSILPMDMVECTITSEVKKPSSKMHLNEIWLIISACILPVYD